MDDVSGIDVEAAPTRIGVCLYKSLVAGWRVIDDYTRASFYRGNKESVARFLILAIQYCIAFYLYARQQKREYD